VPIGTVRSRLSEARRKLTVALLESAATAYDDTAGLRARRHAQAQHLITSGPRGEFHRALAAAATPNLHLFGPQRQRAQGLKVLIDIMDSDLEAGVRQRLRRVTASRRLTILECDLVNPAWDPQHCPPEVLWLMTVHDERIERIKLFHPAKSTPP
jgi:hypothetical protein